MKIIKIVARVLEHAIPFIKLQESKGLKFFAHEDDGVIGQVGVQQWCCKKIYFDDSKSEITYEDLTEETKSKS